MLINSSSCLIILVCIVVFINLSHNFSKLLGIHFLSPPHLQARGSPRHFISDDWSKAVHQADRGGRSYLQPGVHLRAQVPTQRILLRHHHGEVLSGEGTQMNPHEAKWCVCSAESDAVQGDINFPNKTQRWLNWICHAVGGRVQKECP